MEEDEEEEEVEEKEEDHEGVAVGEEGYNRVNSEEGGI